MQVIAFGFIGLACTVRAMGRSLALDSAGHADGSGAGWTLQFSRVRARVAGCDPHAILAKRRAGLPPTSAARAAGQG